MVKRCGGKPSNRTRRRKSPRIFGKLAFGLVRRVARRVLGTTHRALGRALGLVHLALGLGLGVTGRRAHGVLHGTFRLVGGARDAILVHGGLPPFPVSENGTRCRAACCPRLLGGPCGLPPGGASHRAAPHAWT